MTLLSAITMIITVGARFGWPVEGGEE